MNTTTRGGVPRSRVAYGALVGRGTNERISPVYGQESVKRKESTSGRHPDFVEKGTSAGKSHQRVSQSLRGGKGDQFGEDKIVGVTRPRRLRASREGVKVACHITKPSSPRLSVTKGKSQLNRQQGCGGRCPEVVGRLHGERSALNRW